MPSVYVVDSAIMWANASSVRTCSSVARIAATDSALPAIVPPTPPMSTRSRSVRLSTRSANSADMPYAPAGMPPPIALPITTRSGVSPQAAQHPPGPAEKVCVSSMISSVP